MAGRRRTVAKAKPITSKQVKGYGYVPNPGVRTIVAVNGKGAYRRAHRSAREVMAPLSPPARRRRARTATRSERSARTGENTMRRNAKTRVRRALSGGRPAARRRATPRRRPMRRNAQPRSYAKGWEATFGKKRKTAKKAPARRKSPAKKKLTKAERAEISRRNLAKARAARKRGSSKTTRRRSTTGRKKKLTKAERAAISRRNLAKARAARRKPKMAANRRRSTTRRKTTARRRPTRTTRRRPTAAQRRASSARRRAVTRRSPKRQTAAQRRASLKNLRKARASQRRRPSRRPASSRRRMRKNARGSYRKNKSYRRNQGVMGLVKTAGYIAGGLMAHKALMGLADSFLVKPMFAPAPAAPVEGLPASAQPLVSNLVSVALAAGGIYVTRQVVKNKADADAIVGGMAASAVHKALVSVISMVMPTAAGYLSGLDDSTAARLSAMYGLGTSIQPYYAPISGMGEYFESGVGLGEYFESGVGLGEYFASGVNGPLGEYFESGVENLGNYGQNPDLLQAAAGFGAMGESNTNIIDPTSDLDHQLTIAEAAAGVGSAYEAAAGYGELYEAAAGMGAIQDTPRASTWVPGQTNPQLWAGVRAIDRSQQATARVPAGVLASPGGGGIFG